MAALVLSLLLSWTWAQHQHSLGRSIKFSEILSAATVEWGALLTLILCHVRRLQPYHEAPPLKEGEYSVQQIPVIFVPSLHLGVESFQFLFWRLKKNYWNSLWPFQWKSFLQDPVLLEDQLRNYLIDVISKTEAKRFRIISHGTSRPIVSRVLNDQNLHAYCDRWIAISAPQKLSQSLSFLTSKRVLAAYENREGIDKSPDLNIIGENDSLCYPREVFGEGRQVTLNQVGYLGSLLHSTTTQSILKEFVV